VPQTVKDVVLSFCVNNDVSSKPVIAKIRSSVAYRPRTLGEDILQIREMSSDEATAWMVGVPAIEICIKSQRTSIILFVNRIRQGPDRVRKRYAEVTTQEYQNKRHGLSLPYPSFGFADDIGGQVGAFANERRRRIAESGEPGHRLSNTQLVDIAQGDGPDADMAKMACEEEGIDHTASRD